jgi:hypothetical protein
VDTGTGYPYYWNTKTNEVVWEKPKGFRVDQQRQQEAPPDASNRQNITSWPINRPTAAATTTTTTTTLKAAAASASAAKTRKAATAASSLSTKKRQSEKAAAAPAVVYGPSLPEPKPEEIAMQKIKKFEEEFAKRVLADVENENPPDWRDTMPRALHTKAFAWNQKQPLLPVWKALVARESAPVEARPAAISLIAGYDSCSDSEEEPEEPPPPHVAAVTSFKAGSKRKIEVQVKAPLSKVAKTAVLKLVPSIFREDDDEEEEKKKKKKNQAGDGSDRDDKDKKKTEPAEKREEEKKSSSSSRRDRHGRKTYEAATGMYSLNALSFQTDLNRLIYAAGASYKKSIDAIAETLCDKLESLKVGQINVSQLKILAVKVEVSFLGSFKTWSVD